MQLLDDNMLEYIPHINIMSLGYLAQPVPGYDNSAIIQSAADYAKAHKKRLYIPPGTFECTNVNFDGIFVYGVDKFTSILKNNSTVTPCVSITHVRTSLSHLGIIGNGTINYGENATTERGVLLDGTVGDGCAYVNIDDCDISNHGSHGIDMSGGVWIVNITRCVCNSNKLDGIRICNVDGQKNAINIDKCTIAFNGRNGVFAWGLTINITNSISIEMNKGAGVSMDYQDLPSVYVTGGTSVVNIIGNHIENCGRGAIFCRAGIVVDEGETYYTSVDHVTIMGNYSNITDSTFSYYSLPVCANCTFAFEDFTEIDHHSRVMDIYYGMNGFNLTGITTLIDGGDCLDENCTVVVPVKDDYTIYSSVVKLGKATLINAVKTKTVNGYLFCKGFTYATPDGLSDDIATGTSGYFPIPMSTQSKIYKMGIYVSTDSTNYRVRFRLKYRDGKTVDAYSEVDQYPAYTKSGSQYVSTDYIFSDNSGRILETMSDIYLEVVVTIITPGTSFKLGNLVITYQD
jgi:hypothetical protein